MSEPGMRRRSTLVRFDADLLFSSEDVATVEAIASAAAVVLERPRGPRRA